MKTKRIGFILLIALLCALLAMPAWAEGTIDEEKRQQLEELYLNKDYEGTVACAEEVLSVDPTYMTAYQLKANACFHLGAVEEARETLEAQLRLNPNNALALYNFVCANAMLGDVEAASSYAKKLITMDITAKGRLSADEDMQAILDDPLMQFLNEIDVRVGGKLLSFDVAPKIVNDRTLVPMRAIFAELGAEVEWDAETLAVTAKKGNTTVSLTINSQTAKINGEDYALEAPAMIFEDRTLVPCRFVSDVFGAEVLWDAENLLVEILPDTTEGSEENYDTVYRELAEKAEVLYVDGMWYEPYSLERTEGLVMIAADSEADLQKMCLLDEASRKKLMAELVMTDYAVVIGCDPIYTQFIYDGRIYFEGEFHYEEQGTLSDFTTYINGLPTNVVRQDKEQFNYSDYYFGNSSAGGNPAALPHADGNASASNVEEETVADLAAAYSMTTEEFITYYALPETVNGGTKAAEAEALIPFWRMAEINEMTFEDALELFGLPSDFNPEATMGEVYDAMPIGVLAASYDMTYEQYLEYFGIDPAGYDEATPYGEIRKMVEGSGE